MWREAAAHSCRGGGASQLGACRGGRPVASARRAVDDAQQRTHWELAPRVKPGLKFFPPPRVHADLATAPTLTTTDQQRAAPLIKITLGERERFLDTQAGAPPDHDQPA